MAKKPRIPSTAALRVLDQAGIAYDLHPYDYVERGGTRASAAALGQPQHSIIKTLIFEDEVKAPLVVLMHGDFEVSAKALARVRGCRAISPCDPDTAQRHSGYKVGGTSPFGLKKALPIYVEASILDLPRIFINGGARGLLVSLDPQVLVTLLGAVPVQVARSG
jgi:Cys-tRNA(Pro) deacylase